jgi:hypothetical protein
VFEIRVLRRMFGPKGDEVTGSWRKWHEKFHNLCSSPDIIRMIKSRMKWTGYEREGKCVQSFVREI